MPSQNNSRISNNQFLHCDHQGLVTHHKIVTKTQFSKQNSQFCLKSKQVSKQISLLWFSEFCEKLRWKEKEKLNKSVNAFERKSSDIFAYLRRKIHVQKLTCARVFFFVEKSVRSSPRTTPTKTTLTTFTSSPSALWRRRAFCYERGLSFESEQPRSIQQREQHEYTSARVRINERSSILKAEADTDDDVVDNYVNSVTRRKDSPFLMKCRFSVKLTEEQKSWQKSMIWIHEKILCEMDRQKMEKKFRQFHEFLLK